MKFLTITILVTILTLTGCGTILTLSCNPEDISPKYKHCMLPHIYSGTFHDVTCQWGPPLDEGPADSVKAMLFYDIPFSLVADTVVLPVTFVKQVRHGNIWNAAEDRHLSTNAPASDADSYALEPVE
jgi:uncharacterized protein YceK